MEWTQCHPSILYNTYTWNVLVSPFKMNPNLKDQADQVGEAYAREIRLKSKNWLFRSSTFLFHGFLKLNTVQKLQKGTNIKDILKHVDKVPDDSTKQANTPLNTTKSKQFLYSETNLCLNCYITKNSLSPITFHPRYLHSKLSSE